MNNSNYAAEQIVNMLIKRGWVATNSYDVNILINDISTIILNASLTNVQVTTNVTPIDCVTKTFDGGKTYTFTL